MTARRKGCVFGAVAMALLVAACYGSDGFSFSVANESGQTLIVHYTSDHDEGMPEGRRVEPGERRIGLGGTGFAIWRDGRADVLTLSCERIGSVVLSDQGASLRITAELEVLPITAEQARPTSSEELVRDIRCLLGAQPSDAAMRDPSDP